MYEMLIKIIADGAVVPVVLIGAWALLWLIPNENKYAAYCRILMAGLTAYLFAKLIGSIYQPEMQRPFEVLGVQAKASFLDNPGFPSDHLLFCATITLAVWFETRHKKVTFVLVGLSLLVALGRVLGLVHTPLDVIGGVLIASIGALWCLQRSDKLLQPNKPLWHKKQKSGKV